MYSLLAIAFVALAFISWLIAQPLLRLRRRKQIRAQPFPEHWRHILRARVPYFRKLPADLQLQLKRHIQVFIAEKKFVGCNGVVITDEIRVTIAAHACLLILNRPTDYYPMLREILVYPSAFVTDRAEIDNAGVVHNQRQVLLGESWSRGQVVLSWENSVNGADWPDDGRNVIIHEFAHQLDQEKGVANGAPFLASPDHHVRWAEVFNQHFDALRSQIEQYRPTLLDAYAAKNPAEFFAVASELFFEKPLELANDAPALYKELERYYCVNPLDW